MSVRGDLPPFPSPLPWAHIASWRRGGAALARKHRGGKGTNAALAFDVLPLGPTTKQVLNMHV